MLTGLQDARGSTAALHSSHLPGCSPLAQLAASSRAVALGAPDPSVPPNSPAPRPAGWQVKQQHSLRALGVPLPALSREQRQKNTVQVQAHASVWIIILSVCAEWCGGCLWLLLHLLLPRMMRFCPATCPCS